MRKLLVLVMVVGTFLAVTNPKMEAFQTFVRTHAADRIQQELGDGTLSDLLSGAGSELLSNNVDQFTERRSYLVCSLYTLDLDRDGRSNGQALGIAGQFLVLEEFGAED